METDPQSGMTYYYNWDTQQSQWERPPNVSLAVQEDYQNYHKETAAKRNWHKLVDATTGSYYYFDESTGEYQWEIPKDIDNDPSSYGGTKYDWQEIQSAALNWDTQQSQRERPKNVSLAVQEGHQNYDKETTATRNWHKLLDVTTGSYYYFDESTGENQWEIPKDIDNDPTSYGGTKDDWQEIQSEAASSAAAIKKPLRNSEIERYVGDIVCQVLPDRQDIADQ